MNKKHIILTLSLVAGTLSMSSCLDYDHPEDTLSVNQNVVVPTPETGKGSPDSIPYHNVASEAFFKRKDTPAQGGQDLGGLRSKSTQQLLSQAAAGYFCLRGGKKSEMPGPHAYQYAFSVPTTMLSTWWCLTTTSWPVSSRRPTPSAPISVEVRAVASLR